MAVHTVETYLTQLGKESYVDTLCLMCEGHLSQHPMADRIEEEVHYVVKCLLNLASLNGSSDRFDVTYLRRVISKFRTDPEVQALELQILDAILLLAQNEFGITSAKVPSIIKLRRDRPILRPDSMLLANAAARLRQVLLREQMHPTALTKSEAVLGRLLLHLFFLERVETIEQALYLAKFAPKLEYLDGIVCLDAHYRGDRCRYVLSESGAVWWLQWLRLCADQTIHIDKPASFYLSAYLATVPDWHFASLGIIKLKLLRKIDYSLRLSPIGFAFLTGYTQSQLLPPAAFFRLLTNRTVSHGRELTDSGPVMTIREQRSWHQQNQREQYASVAEQEAELKHMLDSLRPPKGRHVNGRLAVGRSELIAKFGQWLEVNQQAFSPYLWLVMAWAKALLTEGGQVKANLKPTTIVDYVMSVGPAFMSLMSPYRVDALGADDWLELLNQLTQMIKSPHRKGFVVYLATFLRDSELVQDLPVEELEVVVRQGGVDANLVSVNHVEIILSYLLQRKDQIARDAALLLCLCFFSGLRRSEAAFLQLADVAIGSLAAKLEGHVDLHVRSSVRRGLKSASSRRVLPLDVLWPRPLLDLLHSKVIYRRSNGGRPTSLLFEGATGCEPEFRLITDLLHQVTGDRSIRIHHLRHSFANWQWFRLNPALLDPARQQVSLFAHDTFSAQEIDKLHRRLGLQPYSRKSMFVLCHLLGHADPATTISSYLHLKDLAGYLALGAEQAVSKKLVSHALGRSIVTPRQDIGDSLAMRLTFENRRLEAAISPVPYGRDFSSALPALASMSDGLSSPAPAVERDVLDWAGILMACRSLSAEQVAANEGMASAQVRRLLDLAQLVQSKCPGRGRSLPLIPALAPWVVRLIEERKADAQASGQDKPASFSLQILHYLFDNLQKQLDQGQLSWEEIRTACHVLQYLVPGKGYLIRSPSRVQAANLLKLVGKLGLKAGHIRLTLFLAEPKGPTAAQLLSGWKSMIDNCGIKGLHMELGWAEECTYFKKRYLEQGVLQLALVNRRLGTRGRRQRIFVSLLQLMAILSLYFTDGPQLEGR